MLQQCMFRLSDDRDPKRSTTTTATATATATAATATANNNNNNKITEAKPRLVAYQPRVTNCTKVLHNNITYY